MTLPVKFVLVKVEVAVMGVPTRPLSVWLDGLMEGVGAAYVNKELAGFVPPIVVTDTLTVPAVPAVVEQVREVAVLELTEVHALPPMVTPVALLK